MYDTFFSQKKQNGNPLNFDSPKYFDVFNIDQTKKLMKFHNFFWAMSNAYKFCNQNLYWHARLFFKMWT
jgi:hypothetical protein